MKDVIDAVEQMQLENQRLRVRQSNQKTFCFSQWFGASGRVLLGNCFNEWKKLLYRKRSLELVNAAVVQCKAQESEKLEKHMEAMRVEYLSKREKDRWNNIEVREGLVR